MNEPGGRINGDENNFIQELLFRTGQDRKWGHDLRVGSFDGNLGHMFRDSAAGGFCMANPKLDVSRNRLLFDYNWTSTAVKIIF